VNKTRDEIRERNRQIEDGVFAAISDPRRPKAAPKAEPVPPVLNLAPLDNAVTELSESAKRYEKALNSARSRLADSVEALRALNTKLRQSEPQLVDTAGLPGREWYQPLLYAPGFYTGYSVKTLPGVRESIEQGHYTDAEREAARVAQALARLAGLVDSASADLARLTR
jgi:N-acetylated-alpha-linked acidic dipeptidase